MSTINTNSINVNYPVPGVNNSSQGFRDNFTSIKTNLDTAGNEITDLQNVVVVKSALANTAVNNDMANTLISNASTRSFRATTYNLGSSLSGTIIVNTSLGDVQYGTVAANTTIQFAGWAPTGTQSNVQLQLTIANTDASVIFPTNVSMTGSYGIETVENFANVAGVPTVTAAAGVSQLDFRFSTVDCGTTIYIEPYNRPRRSTQVQNKTPSPVGLPGDEVGAVAVDANYMYVCTDSYNAIANTITISNTTATTDLVSINNTAKVTTNDPIILQSNIGGLVANTVYYVKAIINAGAPGNITVSASRTGGTAGANVTLTTDTGAVTAVSYNGTDIWKRVELTTW